MLLVGPPGLGKTSLAHIVREELGVGIRTVAGPALERKGDLAAILTSLETRDVLFIDEIHRLNPRGRGDPLPGARGLPARHRRRPGPGGADADARPAAVHARRRDDAHRAADDAAPRPLRDDLPARVLRVGRSRDDRPPLGRHPRRRIADEAADEIARRSRGTPRVANRILRRVRDVAEVRHAGEITAEIAREALELLEVDEEGLERTDRELLEAIVHKFGGGPVGLSTLAVTLGEESDTIEDVYEPYLLQLGFIQRTPRGRIVTDLGLAHVAADQAARADSLF